MSGARGEYCTQNPNDPGRALAIALSDTLWPHRISNTCKAQLEALWQELDDIKFAISNLAGYPFFSGPEQADSDRRL